MKRLAVLVAAIAMMLTGLTTATANAAENAPGAALVNCNHWNGPGTVVKAVYVRANGDGAAVGAAQLCRQGSYYWAYVVFYAPLPAGSWGQAYLQRFRGGTVIGQWSCDTPPIGPPDGGNGYVKPRQTQCWTKKIYGGGSTDTFRAIGAVYYGTHPDTSWTDARGITSPPAR
jgi:hypothetical protein